MSREAAIAAAVSVVVVGTMAIDHLVGTESEPGESGLADPPTFLLSVMLALLLVWLLFALVVRRAVREEPEESTLKAVALFLAVPFAFAGAGLALGLHAREGRRWVLGTAAVVVGGVVIAVGVLAYVVALIA